MESSFCSICSSNDSKLLYKLENHSILLCRNCGNARTFPPPDDYDYEEGDFHVEALGGIDTADAFEKLPAQWKQAIWILVEMLDAALPRQSSILEIGCGEGILLKKLGGRGFDVSGIEPSSSASERARNMGLNVNTAFFSEETAVEPFDAIILSHVLEHLPDPVGFLKLIRRKNPKAKLLLAQANFRGLIPRLRGPTWYAYAPHQHYWHFSLSGIEKLLSMAGYKLTSVKHSSLCHAGLVNAALNAVSAIFPALYDQFFLIIENSPSYSND